MVSLTSSLITMRFGVLRILCFLGRVFGNQRFLGEWRSFCGLLHMVGSSLWIILCLGVARWNLVPRCSMWIVWLERNRHSFEDNEKTLDELNVLCQHSLLEWSHCWGFTDCSSLSEFMLSLSLVS